SRNSLQLVLERSTTCAWAPGALAKRTAHTANISTARIPVTFCCHPGIAGILHNGRDCIHKGGGRQAAVPQGVFVRADDHAIDHPAAAPSGHCGLARPADDASPRAWHAR